jgi:hypothetical protein
MKQSTKTLLLWALLVAMFVAIWQFLTPPPGHHAPPAAPVELRSWLPAMVACGVLFSAVFALRKLSAGGRAHNAALHASGVHLVAGRFDEAEEVLLGLAGSRLPQFRRAYHVQRAIVALWRGDGEAALLALEPAIAEPEGRLFRSAQHRGVTAARSLRAFLRAASGDEAGAQADIASLRAEIDLDPQLLARAALAEARLLDGKGDRAALGRLLEEHRGLLAEAIFHRERALVRAYEAMIEASAASVYRQKGDAAPVNDDAASVAAWVACFAPNAAPFVRAVAVPPGTAAARAEVPSADARRWVAAARPSSLRDSRAVKTLGLWVVLVGVFLAIWTARDASPGGDLLLVLLVIAAGGGIVVWMAQALRKNRRAAARIARAASALNAGDLERAAAAVAFEPDNAQQRAQAAQLAAEVALRSGAMTDVLDHCDRAFKALASLQGGTVTTPVAPAAGKEPTWDLARLLTAQRAVALAALGRSDEAWAEIEWAHGFPSGLPVYHVLLVTRLVAEDYEGAARAVESRMPVALLPRDETLAELTCFVGRPETRTAANAARLRAELRRNPALRRWVEARGPKLQAAFERAAAEVEAGEAIAP